MFSSIQAIDVGKNYSVSMDASSQYFASMGLLSNRTYLTTLEGFPNNAEQLPSSVDNASMDVG